MENTCHQIKKCRKQKLLVLTLNSWAEFFVVQFVSDIYVPAGVNPFSFAKFLHQIELLNYLIMQKLLTRFKLE